MLRKPWTYDSTFTGLDGCYHEELCRKVISDKELDTEKKYKEYDNDREIGTRYSLKVV